MPLVKVGKNKISPLDLLSLVSPLSAVGEIGSGINLLSKAIQRRAYGKTGDSLLGFAKEASWQKGFFEQNYSLSQRFMVKFKGEKAFTDEIAGLNKAHILERAKRNWPDAEVIPLGSPIKRSLK